MKKILRLFVYLIIWALIAVLVFAFTANLDLPVKTGLYLLTGLFVLWLAFLIIRKSIVRYKAKMRVKDLINEEKEGSTFFNTLMSHIPFNLFGEISESDELTKGFHNLLKLLKKSYLKNEGDPIYVLPWYIMIGASGTGKTFALEKAQLPAPIFKNEFKQYAGCNWIPYNQAVFIDTPGEYVPEKDQRGGGWQKLLWLLKKHREKEPLNGIVIAIDAERFLKNDENALYEEGRKIRAQIHEAMTRLLINVPVYLLITKADFIEGFDQWCSTFTPEQLNQPMGCARAEDDEKAGRFISKALDYVVERIKDINLLKSSQCKVDFRTLQLPGIMESIKLPLASYADGIFQDTPYQETPNLRGVYFCSATPKVTSENVIKNGAFLQKFFTDVVAADRRLRSPVSHTDRVQVVMKRLIYGGWGVAVILAFMSLFMTYRHNMMFFEKMKKQYAGTFVKKPDFEENLYSLERHRGMIIQIEDKIGGWWLPWFENRKNPEFLKKIKENFVYRFQGELNALDKRVDNRFQSLIFQSLPEGGHWKRPGKIAKPVFTVQIASFRKINRAKQKASNLLNNNFRAFYSGPDNNQWYRVCLGPYQTKTEAYAQKERLKDNREVNNLQIMTASGDKVFKYTSAAYSRKSQKIINPALSGQDYKKIAGWVESFAHRINFIDAFLKNTDISELEGMPQPFVANGLYFAKGTQVETLDSFNEVYIEFLEWNDDKEALKEKLTMLRTQLKDLLIACQNDLKWIIPLVNDRIKPDTAFMLSSYWPGTVVLKPEIRIDGAYTLAGKKDIDAYLAKILKTDPTSSQLQKMISSFELQYQKDYLKAWENFALNFDKGLTTLCSRGEWVALIDRIAMNKNPYFQALDLMFEQTQPFKEESGLPEWLKLIRYYHQMKLYNPNAPDTEARDKVLKKMALGLAKKVPIIGKSLSKIGKKAMKTQKKLGGPPSDEEMQQQLENAGKTLGDYTQAFKDISFGINSRASSFQAMVDFFSNPDNIGAGKGPESTAFNSVLQLQMMIGKETEENRAFWALYAGPVEVYRKFMIKEASCVLQKKWEDDFLVEIEDVPQYKLSELMFGSGGKVWQFLENNTKPFISRAFGKGYVPVKLTGEHMPFCDEFLDFISRGRALMQTRPENYPVTLKAMPTTSNPDAKMQPDAVVLTMQCADSTQTISNYNFIISSTFNWTDKCGDVVLSLEIGGLILEKIYQGQKAFPTFLKEFNDGSRRFTPEEFPEHSMKMHELGIEYIDVQFEITGHQAVIATLESSPSMSAPKSIITCWGK